MLSRKTAARMVCIPAILAAGCSQQTVQSAQKDTQHNINVIDQQAKKLSEEAKPQIDKLDLGARVSAALAANDNLRGTHIRVDASPSGVRLKGTVKTAQQKTLASQVAKQTLPPGKSVENDLTATGG
jgi:osmotically-inducible protein OsmY